MNDSIARQSKKQPAARRSKQLRLDQIRLDGGTQPRTDIDHFMVDNYAEAYASGAKFPPVVVFFDGKVYWLADGFHRWWASRKAERKTILCEIRNGTQADAQWYSYAANRTHGLHRSNADKQKAVQAALLHPNGAKMSDGQIAEHVGVSQAMVSKHRRELAPTQKDFELTPRKGRDGKTRNVANIGKKKSSAPVLPPAPVPPLPVESLEPDQELPSANDALAGEFDSASLRAHLDGIYAEWCGLLTASSSFGAVQRRFAVVNIRTHLKNIERMIDDFEKSSSATVEAHRQ